MKAVVGVFKSRFDAVNGIAALAPLGLSRDRIKILMPHPTEGEIAAVPVMDAEQPGMGKAMGATVGGAMGFAAGETLASLLIPGVGPVLVIGLAAAALGALGGGAAGGAVENSMNDGLPGDELFIYEDALRQGRSVVIAMTEDDRQAEAVRGVLEKAGAESIDRAHEMWWVGLRDVEKEAYAMEVKGGNFEDDERCFRCGFEAAQHAGNRGKTYEACRPELSQRYPDIHERDAFQRGFSRGRAYLDEIMKQRNKYAMV